ncbi:hypothetical protein CRG98_014399 [Punica granatum]|uniref:Uncharacterized protein n=1 Tax=Punica granatum TaxID=22663 RepID=A0A2I0KAP1_PUNGR|nr:hypothetical protein CRG98_014399 [Punica granatum]
MYGLEFRLVETCMRATDHTVWKYPPSWGCTMDTRKKESPLPVYDPGVEGQDCESRRDPILHSGRAPQYVGALDSVIDSEWTLVSMCIVSYGLRLEPHEHR